MLDVVRQGVPSLGSFGGDASSSLTRAELGVDLFAIVTKPCQVCGEGPFRRIWILCLALALLLCLGLGTLLLDFWYLRELPCKEGCEVELADVKRLASSENSVGMADIRASSISECTFKCDPRGNQLRKCQLLSSWALFGLGDASRRANTLFREIVHATLYHHGRTMHGFNTYADAIAFWECISRVNE